ncbi:Hpt domain-containing protein [Bowmanella dokdonensis]|uniref:Hpt domain-containing protein n=1 Tax=Bowmanella dokdonensis TaxID=751969 RepID=A0A939DRH4_9ALTE|nr:Hpt domain-containing protein [Bowmanella dokdonensis]MBN7827450.1 Hpt domain-containing protein [Bowmanella dokdonensis]
MQAKEYFDSPFAIEQLGGDEPLLCRLLDRFVEQYATSAGEVAELLQQGQWQQARQLVHTVKGVAGNLGMRPLYQTSNALEQLLKQKSPDSAAQLVHYRQDLQLTLEALNEFRRQQVGQTASPAASIQQLDSDKARQMLLETLRRNEFIAPNRLDALLVALPLSASRRHELRECISDLNYSAALELLQET